MAFSAAVNQATLHCLSLLLRIMPASRSDNIDHLVFCALTALHLARQDHPIDSLYAENIFLLRWLTLAQKQKRFPKAVADDITLLIRLGQLQGATGSLRQKLEALWQEAQPHPLKRLTRAVIVLTEQGWENVVTTDEEWASGLFVTDADGPAFFVCKSALTAGFSDTGALVAPVDFKICGDVDDFIATFNVHNLVAELVKKDSCSSELTVVTLSGIR